MFSHSYAQIFITVHAYIYIKYVHVHAHVYIYTQHFYENMEFHKDDKNERANIYR